MNITSFVKHVLGEKVLGAIDYYRFPAWKDGCGGPFNGQQFRQRMFLELIQKLGFPAIVETGTYRGTTTEYMHKHSRLPVYTVEVCPRYYGYAKARLFKYGKVKVFGGDSRSFLGGIARNPDLAGRQLFFYLDAHWEEDLPLREEVQIIFAHWPDAVVMIDDFKVPDDVEYLYDDYGEGKRLSLEYLAEVIRRFELSVFFPSESARLESGGKHGCMVTARAAGIIQKIQEMATLTLHR